MWFEELMGFREESPEQVRENLLLSESDGLLTSKVNGKSYVCGKLEIPQLADLRAKLKKGNLPKGRLSLKENCVGCSISTYGSFE